MSKNDSILDVYTLEDLTLAGQRLHVNTVVVLIINLTAGYIIHKHSTKAMGNYRYFLMVTIIASTIMDLHLSFFWGPLLTFPLPGVCSAGFVASHFDYFWGEVIQHLTLHYTISFVGISLVVAIAYRYAVMLQKEEFFIRWYGILIIAAIIILYPTLPTISFILTIKPKEVMLNFVKTEAPYLYDLYGSAPCSANKLEPIYGLYFIITGIHIIAVFIMGAYISRKVWSLLKSQKHMLSKTTYKLYNQMLCALIVQLSVPFIGIVAPIITLFGFIILEVPHTKVYAMYLMQFISFHSISNSISIILIIKPYRRALLRILLFPVPERYLRTKVSAISRNSTTNISSVVPRGSI